MRFNEIKLKYIAQLNPSKSELNLGRIKEQVVSFLPMDKIISTNKLDLSLNKTVEEVYSGYTYFREGDIVLAKVTPCFENGNLAVAKGLTNGAGFGTTELHVLRVNEKFYDTEYIYYCLQLEDFKSEAVANMYGVGGLKRISTEFLSEYKFLVPDLDTQIRIRKYLNIKLNEISTLIRNKTKLIKLLEQQRQSIITQAATKGLNPNVKMKDSDIEWVSEIPEHWEVKKLKHLGKFVSGYAFPSNAFVNNGIKVIKINNIQTMNLDWSDISYVAEDWLDKLNQYQVSKGDLVIALTRPIISTGIKAAIVDTDEALLLNQRNAYFRNNKLIPSIWLYYLVLNQSFVEEFESLIDRTGQQPNISTNDIENIKIPLPSLEEIQQITNYLNKKINEIEKIKVITLNQIEKLKEYRQALIYEAVTGKIDVRDMELDEVR